MEFTKGIVEKNNERYPKFDFKQDIIKLRIENHTDKLINNEWLLGAFNSAYSKDIFNANGDYEKDGIKIVSEVEGLSYRQLLNQTLTQPFQCVQTVVDYCGTAIPDGLNTQPFLYEITDANGDYWGKNAYDSMHEYRVDGTTRLKIWRVDANSYTTIEMERISETKKIVQ